jgi:hypothetical protein
LRNIFRNSALARLETTDMAREQDTARRKEMSHKLWTTPVLFADEQPEALCGGSPPFGLRGIHGNGTLEYCHRAAANLLACAARNGHKPELERLHHKQCAVIGNSGILLGSALGSEIDAHDAVIRFNAAPSGSVWQPDIGSKSSLRILSSWVAKMRVWRSDDTRSSGDGVLLYCQANWVGQCLMRGVASERGCKGDSGGGDVHGRHLQGEEVLGGHLPADGDGPSAGGGGGGNGDGPSADAGGGNSPSARGGGSVHALGRQRWLINPVFIRHLHAYLHGSQTPPTRATALPSAGLIGAALALRFCRRVTIYGFGDPDAALASSNHSQCVNRALSRAPRPLLARVRHVQGPIQPL